MSIKLKSLVFSNFMSLIFCIMLLGITGHVYWQIFVVNLFFLIIYVYFQTILKIESHHQSICFVTDHAIKSHWIILNILHFSSAILVALSIGILDIIAKMLICFFLGGSIFYHLWSECKNRKIYFIFLNEKITIMDHQFNLISDVSNILLHETETKFRISLNIDKEVVSINNIVYVHGERTYMQLFEELNSLKNDESVRLFKVNIKYFDMI